jgi:hypothetical protein
MPLFLEHNQLVEGWPIVDLQTGANTGDWVSLKNYHHVAIVFISAVGTAGDDPTLTVLQASDVAGTGSKALTFTTIYRKQAATSLASTGTWTATTQSAANTYTNDTSAEQDLIWVVEFDSDQLDVDNGFNCVSATVADIGTHAQLGYLLYILSEPRYPASPANMLTAIA